MELLNTPDDMAWLASIMKKDLSEFGSAVIDDETCVMRVECYVSPDPLITDVRVVFERDGDDIFWRASP